MKKKKKNATPEGEAPGLSLTPMIDVTFLLLIFFMLACKFRTVEGKLKAFLPKRGRNTMLHEPIILNDLRIKLLWCRPGTTEQYPQRTKDETFDDYFQKVQDGHVMLKVGENVIPYVDGEQKWPDYRTALFNYIIEAKKSFTPPRTNPVATLPIIIDAREAVEWKHTVAVLNQAVRAGCTDISLAQPEDPY